MGSTHSSFEETPRLPYLYGSLWAARSCSQVGHTYRSFATTPLLGHWLAVPLVGVGVGSNIRPIPVSRARTANHFTALHFGAPHRVAPQRHGAAQHCSHCSLARSEQETRSGGVRQPSLSVVAGRGGVGPLWNNDASQCCEERAARRLGSAR